MTNQRKSTRTAAAFLALSLFLTLSASAKPLATQAKKERSLYHRLGGYDDIAAVTDDFIGRLAGDPRFEKFFSGFSVDSKKRLRQHFVDQICAATGGPCIYMGRDMKTVHQGLGLTEADWNAGVGHLVEALDKFKVGKREKNELLTIVSSLKKDIVEK